MTNVITETIGLDMGDRYSRYCILDHESGEEVSSGYLRDFGYHDYVIGLLATKKDARAVPPLVFKLNRFKFDCRESAGIWISWTLRKITGMTMGTDKRIWNRWWAKEKVRHPELFRSPDEAPTRGG